MLTDQDTYIDDACLAEVMDQQSSQGEELDYFRDSKTTMEPFRPLRSRDSMGELDSIEDRPGKRPNFRTDEEMAQVMEVKNILHASLN